MKQRKVDLKKQRKVDLKKLRKVDSVSTEERGLADFSNLMEVGLEKMTHHYLIQNCLKLQTN